MSKAVKVGTRELVRLLSAEGGVASSVAALMVQGSFTIPGLGTAQILTHNVSIEVAEKSIVKYPVVYVYCERVTNSLREKFRTFSGKADLTIEVRVSHDHVDELESSLQLYVEAITDVLDRNRGEWQDGVYYSGGYEVLYGPARRGGKNYLQIAKVRIETNIGMN